MFRTLGKTTLVRKILWGVLPVVLVALSGVGLSLYTVASSKITEGVNNQVHILAGQLSANLESFFEQNQHDTEAVAEIHSLKEYFANVGYHLDHEAGVNVSDIQEYCTHFMHRAGIYDSVLFFDAQQKLITGVRSGQPVNKADYHKLQLIEPVGAPIWTSPIQSDAKETWINYAMPLLDDSGTRSGVVVLTCNLENVVNLLKLVGEHGSAYIVNADGKVILGVPSHTTDVIQASAKIEHNSDFVLQNMHWSVKVEADRAEFLKPLVRLRDLSLILLGLIAVIAPLLLAWGVRRATHPIVDLVAGTRKLAAGDLDYRFPVPPIRELGVLAESFNDMAEKLKLREMDLRSRIRQLTALRNMETTVIERLKEEAILRSCLDAVASGLGFDRTALYWVDEQQKNIVGRYLHQSDPTDLSEDAFRRRRVALGNPDILNQVMKTHEPALVQNSQAAPVLVLDNTQNDQARQFVMAPICGKDRVFGVIAADNLHTGRPLTESDRDGLMLFAGAAGLALENTGLFDRLSVSEARHRLVLDNSPVAILGLSEDYTINTWNRGAETMFGYTAADVMGKPIESLFSTVALEYAKLVGQVTEHGGVREYAIAGVGKGGKALDLTLSWDGYRPDGAVNKEWAVVIRDVTEAKKMQRQLIFSEKLSAVGQLISGIAHELNNPLQAVVGYAEIINKPRPAGSELPVREIKHIFDNATRCRKIIDNLLLFVRQGEVRKSTIKMQDVIRASLELLQHKIRKTAGVEVTADMPEEPLYAKANFQQIEQVIVNIVNNACDAMEGYDGPRKMRISAQPVESKIHVTLADTGPGIPAEVVAHIFEPFFTTKPEGRGTGLGLPVCRQIVEEHGGELRVDTIVGTGTTFSFELPLAQPETAPAQLPESAGPAPESPTYSGMLLVIEDEHAIRELLEEVLVAAGHRVETASSLEAAEAKVAAGTFDLIVSDVQLDDGTGVDLYHAWAKHTANHRPPFLFLSGDILSGVIGKAANEEDVYMLQKPIDLQDLRTQVNTILGKHQTQVAMR